MNKLLGVLEARSKRVDLACIGLRSTAYILCNNLESIPDGIDDLRAKADTIRRELKRIDALIVNVDRQHDRAMRAGK